ncbi:hypothetical protein U9M48_044439 [Paspalum notatum var. saurae]|uniref:C3H1-type domain-containing protein n=1 Tax=Paspalum notatum var. saurae TaxID=547442 RepID=A0AAQ3UV07_PASNO
MTSASGGVAATDEIPEVEMEVEGWSPEDPGLVGSKRVRDSSSAYGYYGFCGVTTAEKKPMLWPHDVVHMSSNGTSKIGGQYLHVTHDLRAQPDSNAARLSCSSPAENLRNKTNISTKICTFYTQGWCDKGKNCTFLHERGSLGSTKAGLLAPDCSGNHRGSKEGSQIQHQSNLKVSQFKDSEGSLKQELYRNLIHAYGDHVADKQNSLSPGASQRMPGSTDDSLTRRPTTPTCSAARSFQSGMNKGNDLSDSSVARTYLDVNTSNPEYRYRNLIHVYGEHVADKQNSCSPGASQGMPGSTDDSLTKRPTTPTNELQLSPIVQEKNHKPFMGRQMSLAVETYLNDRGTFPRLDGRSFQSGMNKGNDLSDSSVSRTYLDVNTSNPDYQYRPFGLSISSGPLQFSKNLSAYGGITDNIPNASNNSRSSTGLRNPSCATSEHSSDSPSLRGTSQLGIQSHHLFTSGLEKVGYVDVDKGCGTSKHALLESSRPEPSIMPTGPLSPIKDEVWVTSVPFVPSFSFPYTASPSKDLYDPFVDFAEPKVGNIPCSISTQHTNQYVISGKSLDSNEKLTRNISARGSKESACLITSDRGRSSSLDDNKRVRAFDRKKDAVSNNDKTRDFRFYLAEHIKELIKPIWKEGNLSKDAHKQVVKKSIEKVIDSIEPNQIPTTEESITNYIATCGSKIEKLVKEERLNILQWFNYNGGKSKRGQEAQESFQSKWEQLKLVYIAIDHLCYPSEDGIQDYEDS